MKKHTLKPVHSNKRVSNFIIDYFVFPFIMGFILSLLSSLGYIHYQEIQLWGILITSTNMVILEWATGKTIGKFFTKTKVVTKEGNKPSFFRIVARFLSRMIPFEILSFAFSLHPMGWHDSISGTIVVSDNSKNEN